MHSATRPAKPSPTKPNGIESLGRALEVLTLFDDDHDRYTLTEIKDALGWPLTTVHRVAGVLVDHGYLSREARSKTLRLGPSAVRLVAPLLRGLGPRVAQPHISALAQELGETVNYAVLDGGEVLYLASESSRYHLRAVTPTGSRTPSHCTALGKCLLAQVEPEMARTFLGTEPYEALTEHSILTWGELHVELDKVRAQGYSFSDMEYERGLYSCAVPVRTPSGVPAAINVSAASHRVEVDTMLNQVVPRLQAIAAAIERSQGFDA